MSLAYSMCGFVYVILAFNIISICQNANGEYRLPKSVKPLRYNIIVEPTLEAENMTLPPYNGSIVIDIKVLENTQNITFHVRNISISDESIKLSDSKGNLLKHNGTAQDETKEIFTIYLEEELEEDNYYTLTIENFSGTLNDEKVGFFLAQYKDEEGQNRYLAVTHMEPSDARRAFPCFDEPALKAKFTINIIRPENYSSVANERLLTTINLGNGRFMDTFKESVDMSTYLVSFAVSDYSYKSNGRLRIFGRSEAIKDGRADYILAESEKLLKAMEDFTGINYTLSKMDLFGVPDDYFVSGAMENWGLVVYSEEHLFYSNTSTVEDLKRCTTFTAHELSHQWFGNLVTPNWWRYMWLSEGFAAYFQYHITAVVEPSWRLKEQYIVDHLLVAFENDISPYTGPMNSELQTYYVYYQKSCAVIRMAEHILSHSVFKLGLRKYLEANKFKATDPSHVYVAFQEAIEELNAVHRLGNLSMSDILTAWDSSVGYPLVTVTRNYENGDLTLSQKTYRVDNVTDYNTTWPIPITYVFQSNNGQNFHETKPDFWLTEQSVTINNNANGWLVVNKQQTGYYRVNYDETNWQRLIDVLQTEEFTSIHVINRAQLIFDAFKFAKNGELPYRIPLSLSTYLKEESEYIPLITFLKMAGHLKRVLAASKEYDIFQNYIKDILSKMYAYLGLEEKANDSQLDKLNRIEILKWMCDLEDSQCKTLGLKKLRLWKSNGFTSISPNLEASLLCGAMQLGTEEEWDFLLQQYYLTKSRYQKTRYFEALGCTRNKQILNKFLAIILDDNNTIPESDKIEAISKFTSSKTGLQTTIEYLITHAEETGDSMKDQISMSLGRHITTAKQLEQVMPLKNDMALAYPDIETAVKYKIKWLEKHSSAISSWLIDYNKSNFESRNVIPYSAEN